MFLLCVWRTILCIKFKSSGHKLPLLKCLSNAAMDDLIIEKEEFNNSDDEFYDEDLPSDPLEVWTRAEESCQPKSEAKDAGIVEKFRCDECGKIFGQERYLKRHVSTVHLKEKKFKCDLCDKMFGQAEHLKTHVSTVHLKEMNFECGHCDKSFGQAGHLKTHVLTVHLKERSLNVVIVTRPLGEQDI